MCWGGWCTYPKYCHALTVLNNPPAFSPALSATTFNIFVNTTAQNLPLTSYTPDVDGHEVTMTYSTLPTFAVFDTPTKTFTFTPVLTSEIGVNTFVITLTDT